MKMVNIGAGYSTKKGGVIKNIASIGSPRISMAPTRPAASYGGIRSTGKTSTVNVKGLSFGTPIGAGYSPYPGNIYNIKTPGSLYNTPIMNIPMNNPNIASYGNPLYTGVNRDYRPVIQEWWREKFMPWWRGDSPTLINIPQTSQTPQTPQTTGSAGTPYGFSATYPDLIKKAEEERNMKIALGLIGPGVTGSPESMYNLMQMWGQSMGRYPTANPYIGGYDFSEYIPYMQKGMSFSQANKALGYGTGGDGDTGADDSKDDSKVWENEAWSDEMFPGFPEYPLMTRCSQHRNG